MINSDLESFLETISHGMEVEFVYNNVRYFIQGWNEEDDVFVMCVDQIDPPGTDYVYLKKGPAREPMVEEILTLPLFQGKTFWGIEPVSEWIC